MKTCLYKYNMFDRLNGHHSYQCRCHELLGNDFWFLPEDRCLYDGGKESEDKTVSPEIAE